MGIWQGAVEDMAMTSDFWRARRVLVTGHTGFKGAWLCLFLKRLGAEITGYALPPASGPSLFTMADVANDVHSEFGDLMDLESLRAVVARARPEVVIHLAAQSLVRESYEDPVETFATNVMGTAHLLEICRSQSAIRSIVNVTSDKCYFNREWVWSYRESDRLGGNDPYSASKACAELVTAAFRESFYLNGAGNAGPRTGLATARAGNVIGGGDWARDRLVPDLVRAAIDGGPALIRYPEAVRPWQHVLDSLKGYLRLAELLCSDAVGYAGGWNFGPGQNEARSVRWMADRFGELWPGDFSWRADPAVQPKEARILSVDSSQARDRLGWRPSLDPDSALEWTVDWYRTVNQDPASAAPSTFRQIDEYLNQDSKA